ACPKCSGLGTEVYFDADLIVPNHSLGLKDGAILPWSKAACSVVSQLKFYDQTIAALAKHYNFSLLAPFTSLPEKIKNIILYGSGNEEITFSYDDGLRRSNVKGRFEGVIPYLERKLQKTESNGSKLSNTHKQIGERLLKEVKKRICFLKDVGLDYLTLNRKSTTLSGGESQRIRLASQIGSGLSGVLYVLDEPSIGLHQCDNMRLLTTLKNLRDLGNTVIVVEHDMDTMVEADYLIDVGPGAGVHGGNIISQGTPAEVTKDSSSITGQYLAKELNIDVPRERRQTDPNKKIEIIGARSNNLKNISAHFPIGSFISVTGHDKILGLEYIDKIIQIDQSPIGRTPRSNPATYTSAFTHIRDWFTGLPESKARGYSPGRFSFNVKGGRCEACEGDGVVKIEMHFLPDIYVQCEECKGARYNRETLEVKYKGHSIADVLTLTIDDAAMFFENIPLIYEKLTALQEVGLGYMRLGQSATTLSGGEAQRVKLAKELSKKSTGRTLYILDEPTTGLHIHDIKKLLAVLHKLVDGDNTVTVIEHNLDVIKTSDYIIDIGPYGGNKGGTIVATGTPEDIARNPNSITGQYLKPYLPCL
ncbi:unnamed protein product, partial [Ixodes persulcatus]